MNGRQGTSNQSHINYEERKGNGTDGIIISDKPVWEHSAKELWAILGKRIISMPSKMIGFKPFCLLLATWLLVKGFIRDWIWFCVLVIVLFGIMGLKVVSKWKEH